MQPLLRNKAKREPNRHKETGAFVAVWGESVAFAQIKPAKINLYLFGRFA